MNRSQLLCRGEALELDGRQIAAGWLEVSRSIVGRPDILAFHPPVVA